MKDKTTTTKPCSCWSQIEKRLEPKGVRISPKLSQFQVMPSLNMKLVHVLPLENLDGKKLKRDQPATITMKHCPFCGLKF